MCFYTGDSDWYASITEVICKPASEPITCEECRCKILVGENVVHVHQQEAEECLDCENGGCDCEGECCQCLTPSFGESWDYDRCESCDKFLKSVRVAEIAAGCHPNESQPYLGRMLEDIGAGGFEEAKKYFRSARELYPELKASGYLSRIFKRMFR